MFERRFLKPFENCYICAQRTVQTSWHPFVNTTIQSLGFFCSTSYCCKKKKPARPGFVLNNRNNIDIIYAFKRLQLYQTTLAISSYYIYQLIARRTYIPAKCLIKMRENARAFKSYITTSLELIKLLSPLNLSYQTFFGKAL